MRPIDENTPLDPTSGVAAPEVRSTPPSASPTGPVIDQPTLPPDPATISGKRLERDLEAAFYKGTRDKAGASGTVLYDKSAKPDDTPATETAGRTHEAAPLRVADNT